MKNFIALMMFLILPITCYAEEGDRQDLPSTPYKVYLDKSLVEENAQLSLPSLNYAGVFDLNWQSVQQNFALNRQHRQLCDIDELKCIEAVFVNVTDSQVGLTRQFYEGRSVHKAMEMFFALSKKLQARYGYPANVFDNGCLTGTELHHCDLKNDVVYEWKGTESNVRLIASADRVVLTHFQAK